MNDFYENEQNSTPSPTGQGEAQPGTDPAGASASARNGAEPGNAEFMSDPFFDLPETVGGDDDPLKPDPIVPLSTLGTATAGEAAHEKNEKQGNKPKKKAKTPAGRKESGGCVLPSRRALVFPALGFLFPLAYLFFDLFAFPGTGVMESGAARFAALMTDSAFAANSTGELLGAVFGGETPVLLLSIKNLSLAEFRLPLLTVLACAVLCALSCLCLLIFGEKVIRCRALADFLGGIGLLGAFAPFVGKFAYLVSAYVGGGYSALERAATGLMLSVEALLIVLICCTFLLASVASVHRFSAKAHGETVYAPLLCVRCRFVLAKLMTLVSLLLCLGIVVLFFTGTVYLPDFSLTDWKAAELLAKTGELLRGLIALSSGGATLPQVLTLCAEMFFALQLSVLAIAVAVLIFRFLAVLFTPRVLPKRRGNLRGGGKKTAAAGRGALLIPFWFCLVYQLLVAIPLFAVMCAHSGLSGAEMTMTLLYLSVAFARSLFRVSGTYAVLIAAGALFWHLSAGFYNTMTLRRVDAAKEGEV